MNRDRRLNRIPVQTFLDFFKITLEDYFKLPNVPFPIITENGTVVYLDHYTYRNYDMSETSPEDCDMNTVFEHVLLRHYFVDMSTYINEPILPKYFRYKHSEPDAYQIEFHCDYIRARTQKSSTDIYLDPITGINTLSLSLCSSSYPFTTLDLLNSVSPMLEQILSGKYTGSVVDGNLTLTPIFEPIVETNTMSTIAPVVTNIIDQNKAALVTATKLEVGGLALDLLTEHLLKVLPSPLQVLVTSNPVIKIAVANLVNIIIQQTNLKDPKILAVNDAMLTVSWMETIQTFDFKSIFDGVLNTLPANKIETLVTAQETQS